jgi:uncharacterized repeat protein (TIGR01451 family)
MKRTLLGLVLLSGFVGAGSVGVFYARRMLTSPAATQAESDQAPVASARDMAPTPIPLAGGTQDDRGPAANPFSRSGQPRAVAISEDRGAYGNNRGRDPTSNEIPDAGDGEMPATRSADPFGLRERTAASTSRYAAQPAAAELPEAESTDDAPAEQTTPDAEAEPRRLLVPVTRPQADRYGRANAVPRNEPESADDQGSVAEQSTVELRPEPAAPVDEPADSSDGTGRPGDPQLSGSQAPTLTIEKTAPPEIQIGKPAKFVIKVRNAGSVVAHGVEIQDSIPQGTQLIETTPAATRGPHGALAWDLGSLKPGEEQTVELQLMPMAEGEIGSVATVHFRAEASVRTMATKPMLAVEVQAPPKVLKGEAVTLRIKVSNPGSGAATGVVLSENVPPGLAHPDGKELEMEIGTLKPGESRELELGLTAAAAGSVTNILSAQGEGNLQAEGRADVEVVAPQLQVSMTGPKRRYLERNATHNISVSNPGTSTAKDIELVAVLPKELQFVEANNGGQFDAATHSVSWGLEELPPQETGTVTLTTLPVQAGEARLLIKTTSQAGLTDQREETVTIDGLAALNFQLSDSSGPIEVGGQTTYEVHVTNPGSKAASNVRLVASMPREMKAISAEGPVRYKIEGQRVVFEPLRQLAPKADASFRVKAQALQAGDLKVQVQISSDEIRDPITKEESTRVYGNE